MEHFRAGTSECSPREPLLRLFYLQPCSNKPDSSDQDHYQAHAKRADRLNQVVLEQGYIWNRLDRGSQGPDWESPALGPWNDPGSRDYSNFTYTSSFKYLLAAHRWRFNCCFIYSAEPDRNLPYMPLSERTLLLSESHTIYLTVSWRSRFSYRETCCFHSFW